MDAPHTPTDLTIESRDIHFADTSVLSRWWLGGDPVASAFFNALSASFPMGERYFIDSVKCFRDRADDRLRGQIATFIAQESLHTREHLAFNRIAADCGYDFSRIDAFLKRRFAWARSRSHEEQLASTIALEHFTAILAHALLSDPRHLAGAPYSIRRLWLWHAIEEIEHKGVAYDTFLAATRNYSGLSRYVLRSYVMVVTTILFLHEILFGVRQFFRQDEINTPRTWLRFLHYVLVSPGILHRVARSYFAFFKPGFHPWGIDDRALIAKYEPLLAL
jgi:predicted metal-dependent hydrolase